MELLIIWVATIGASLGLDSSLDLMIAKDMAEQGYKMDINKLKEWKKEINSKVKKMGDLSLFIPFFNLMVQLERLIKYKEEKALIIEQLQSSERLTSTTIELNSNLSKPTKFNNLRTAVKSKINNKKEKLLISFPDGKKKSKIWFKLENNNFIITKVKGPISKLSLREQEKKLNSIITRFRKEIQVKMSLEEAGEINKTNYKALDINNDKQILQKAKDIIKFYLYDNTDTIEKEKLENKGSTKKLV